MFASLCFTKKTLSFIHFFTRLRSLIIMRFLIGRFAGDTDMIERTEWEVVDAPAVEEPRKARHTIETMLGRKWKWKLTGATLLALLTLAVIATLTGLVVVTVTLVALVSFGVRKLKQWWRGNDRHTSLMKRQ